MKRKIAFILLCVILTFSLPGCSGGSGNAPSSEESAVSTEIVTPTPTEKLTETPTPTATPTLTSTPTPTATPTPEPVLSDLDTVLSGANNNQWIYIDGIVDNFKETSTGYDYNIFYQTSDGYNVTIMYPGDMADQITDQKIPEGLKNGDVLRMKQFISEPHAGQSFADVEKLGEVSIDEVYSTYKNSCPELDYDSVIRMPVGVFDENIKCQFTGEIIQVVNEGGDFGTPDYLIKSGENIVYCTFGRNAENRDIRFIEGDTVTIYGDCLSLTTYDTLIGENTVPSIWAYLIDLH